MIKACIFDLDGTLTNTLDSLEYSVNETMKEIGMPQITKEQCRQFVGDGAKVLLERTLKAGGDTKLCHLEEAVEAYARIFDANCMYKVAPYEGIPQMLQQLKESGIKLAVLSNKPDRQAVHVVEEVFGKELFDYIQGQKDGETGSDGRVDDCQFIWGFAGRSSIHRRFRSGSCNRARGKDADNSCVLGIPWKRSSFRGRS